MRSKDLQGVPGPGPGRGWVLPDLKVSYHVALLNCQEKGFPAEGSFLQRAPLQTGNG